MDTLLKVLLRVFRILRSGKYHIKHFPRYWTSLLTYLGRKLSEWRNSWSNEPGTFRKPKPTGPSFLGDSVGSCSMSSSSGGLSGFAFAASTVPSSSSSANPQSAPQVSPNPATLPVNPPSTPRTLSPNPTNQLIGNSPAHRSSASIQSRVSASDRHSMVSSTRTRNSRASSRASARSGQLTQRPRATHRQFGRGPSLRDRDRSSESPSAIPSSHTAQPHHTLPLPPTAYTHTNVDEGLSRSSSIGPQTRTYLPSLSSYSRRATSIGVNIQSPSTESLSNTSSINVQELTGEPTTAGTSFRTISLADRSETASRHSQASSAPSLIPPEGCIVQLINSDQIPRYTKSATTQVDYSILAMLFLHIFADPVRKNWSLWGP